MHKICRNASVSYAGLLHRSIFTSDVLRASLGQGKGSAASWHVCQLVGFRRHRQHHSLHEWIRRCLDTDALHPDARRTAGRAGSRSSETLIRQHRKHPIFLIPLVTREEEQLALRRAGQLVVQFAVRLTTAEQNSWRRRPHTHARASS